jgi:hypothetical protein
VNATEVIQQQDVCWLCESETGTGFCATCRAQRDADVARITTTIDTLADTARRCLEAAWEPRADLLRARADLRMGLKTLARELGVSL